MSFKYFIFLAFAFESQAAENVNESISVVVDLVKKQELPGTVNAYVCWSVGEKLQFWKVCSENLISTKIANSQTPLTYSGQKNQQIFLIDLNCPGSANLLAQADNDGLLRYPVRWILLGNTNFDLTPYYFGIDSKVYVINKIVDGYGIESPYKFSKNDSQLVENQAGGWKGGRWLYSNTISVPRNRSDLMGTPFRVSYVFDNPDSLNHIYDYRDRHIDTVSKSNYLAVHYMIEAINVTEVPPKIYNTRGYKKPNTDKYDNMFGDIQRNEIEISGVSSIITAERMKIQEFIHKSFGSHVRFVFRAPLLAYVTNIFTVPFDTYVWYASFVLVAVILLILYVIVRWEWKLFKLDGSAGPVLDENLFDVFVAEFGALTQQGSEAEPRSVSGRTAMLFTFIAFMFLYNAFCANIIAVLQSTSESIRSPEDLYTSDIAVGAEDIIYSRIFFKAETHPVKKKVVDEKLQFMGVEEGVRRVKNEFFAFHSETTNLFKYIGETFADSDICRLRYLNFLELKFDTHFSVPRNSTYKELLKYTLTRMRESGIIDCLRRRLFSEEPKCFSQGSFGHVGIVECYAAYKIFAVGIGCSVAILLFEMLWKKIKEKTSSYTD